ncbi:MAG TPA: YidC/Oxa1 family membrane protein insertase [Solirubrobacteraceae bacterium]|jgi:YidC/Oxa1 family membrane protein insertase|nr:YidC/Oxa1 family membrane protein insertase [Solirubrobacteraceae bacterium]
MILADVIRSAFGPLISFFEHILVALHSVLGGSWGWSIIGLTLLVRAVTFPLTARQFKGMAKMRAHAPEIDKIKKRYADDKRRQQEEMMKYYKEAGVNPLASCLPLVLQIPVFISLVYMLRKDLKQHICGKAALAIHPHLTNFTNVNCNKLVPHSASFLFVNDITAKATGIVLIVLMVLYVSTMVMTSVMMSVGADRNQRLISIALPVFFVIFVIQFPAGLLVYWIATNLVTIPQQYFNIRRYGRPNAPVKVEANGKGTAVAAREAIKKPTAPPPSARPRKKRSGRRR